LNLNSKFKSNFNSNSILNQPASVSTAMLAGPLPGILAGSAVGVGAANSAGEEVARLDLSSSMVNFLLLQSRKESQSASSSPNSHDLSDLNTRNIDTNASAFLPDGQGGQVPIESFQCCNLVPLGEIFVRMETVKSFDGEEGGVSDDDIALEELLWGSDGNGGGGSGSGAAGQGDGMFGDIC
jgi:hypothetical protein